MPRLKRSDPSTPGIARRKRGTGFEYLDPVGGRVADPEVLQRIKDLVIPPAWTDVWICPDPNGHLQAVGMDAAGRRQYLYHPAWRVRRDAEKFDRMIDFARALPGLRRTATHHLEQDGLRRERVLACAARLLDRGFFRVGSEAYAEQNGSVGLATIRKGHVTCTGDALTFDYPAKGGKQHVQSVVDPAVCEVVSALKRRRGGGEDLLAYRNGSRWVDVRSEEINAYIKEHTGGDFSAKDFRTWHGTVLAAISLAVAAPAAATPTGRKRAMSWAVKQVSHYLGNTPAVCRASYIDPRVFDRYRAGVTIGGVIGELGADLEEHPAMQAAIEEAVIDLIAGEESPALEQVATSTLEQVA
jgi:DNA topoisomerase IB